MRRAGKAGLLRYRRGMIYLLRHGETEFNIAKRFQGSLDSSLTPLGIAQAGDMGRRLRGLIDQTNVALFVSPRVRAIATAQLVATEAGISVAPLIEDGLAEISMGSWDGRTGAEIDAETDGQWSRMNRDTWFFETPDGERYDAFEARLAAALARAKAHPARDCVIVSHGVSIRVLRRIHCGLDREAALAMPVPHGVIYRLDEEAFTEMG